MTKYTINRSTRYPLPDHELNLVIEADSPDEAKAAVLEGFRNMMTAGAYEHALAKMTAEPEMAADPSRPFLALGIETPLTLLRDVKLGMRNIVVYGLLSKLEVLDENLPLKVTKRKGKVLTGPTTILNMFIRDDDTDLFCKVDRFDFATLGHKIQNEGGAVGKSLWVFKGDVPSGFRMLCVKRARYIGPYPPAEPARIGDEHEHEFDADYEAWDAGRYYAYCFHDETRPGLAKSLKHEPFRRGFEDGRKMFGLIN